MKIYKLDIDVSQPIRKVVQMQQNSAGVLSVIVANNNKYIRNLSCELYDGNTKRPRMSVCARSMFCLSICRMWA